MTTYPFVQNAQSPFTFQPTLDGVVYFVVVTWNVFGQRWYFTIYGNDGTRVLTAALVGSPPGYDINLVAGYFTTSTLVFRQAANWFEVVP